MRYGPVDLHELEDVFASNQIAMLGPKTQIFESSFAEKMKVKSALAVSSGTAGLHLALLACGVTPGDEVLVDPLFEHGTLAVLRSNAIPVFYDVDIDTYMPTVAHLLPRITPHTRAVIITNAFGCTADLLAIRALCDEFNIAFIEDCAHALLCTCGNKYAGTFGDIGVFSFHSALHLSLGEGGMMVSNNCNLIASARQLRNSEIWRDMCFSHNCLSFGWGYRISEIISALGISQMKSIDRVMNYYNYIGEYISSAMMIDGVIPQSHPHSGHMFWQWAARVVDLSVFERLKNKLRSNAFVRFGLNHGVDIPNIESIKRYRRNDVFACPYDCIFAGESVKKHPVLLNAPQIASQLLLINITFGTPICVYDNIIADIKEIINECIFNPWCKNL